MSAGEYRGLGLLAIAGAVVLAILLWPAGSDEPNTSVEPVAVRSACTRIVGPRVNLARALARAAPEAVICLRDGRYRGRVIPARATEYGAWVTVRAAPGANPTFTGELAFEGARFLRLRGLSFRAGLRFAPAAANVQVLACELSGEAGIFLFGDARVGGAVRSLLIRGNHIHDLDYRGSQGSYNGYGIKSIGAQEGITVQGNVIKSVAADYLQTDVANGWRVLGNTFLGPSLAGAHPQEHQDLWQIYAGGSGIEFADNVVRGTGTSQSLLFQLTYPGDRFADVVVANNLFDHDSGGYSCQIYQASGLLFRNNTFVGSRFGCLFRRDERYPDGSGYEVARNVFAGAAAGADVGAERGILAWGAFAENVSTDRSAPGPGSVRNWRPRWAGRVGYQPLGLPFDAGYQGTPKGLR